MSLCLNDQAGDEPVAESEPEVQVTTPPGKSPFEMVDGGLLTSSNFSAPMSSMA
jgi:hypothetical protein